MRNTMIDTDYENDDCGEVCPCCDNDALVVGYWHGEYARFYCPCRLTWEYLSHSDYERNWYRTTEHLCRYDNWEE